MTSNGDRPITKKDVGKWGCLIILGFLAFLVIVDWLGSIDMSKWFP